MLKNKFNILYAFLEMHKDLPEQGSDAWHAIRGIGGSELDRLLKNESEVVAIKIGLKSIPDMLAMKWGTLLEDPLRNIISLIFKSSIYEASSIPSAEVNGKTYSMDGMGVIRFYCDEWNGKKYDFFMYLITLFEFKCPFSRNIVHGQIYKDYIPQVLSGMSDLAIPEIALYIEGVFRISRFEMLGYNSHIETWLHKAGNSLNLKPMSYGFIGFYMETIDISDDPDTESLIHWMQTGETDFAKLESPTLLNRLLKFMKNKVVKCWSSDMNFVPKEFARCDFFKYQKIRVPHIRVDMDTQLFEFYKFTKVHKYFPLGILGFKLMDLNIVVIEKEHGYTKKFEHQIKTALEKIKILKNIEDITERESAYNEMYGKTPKTDLDDSCQIDALSAYIS